MHTTSGLACREGSRGASCGALVGGRASTTHSPAQLPPAGRGGQHRSRGLRSNLSAQAGPQLHQKPEQSDAASPLEQGTSLSTWELGARCMLERLYASEEQPATSWLSAPMMVTLDERPQVKRNQDRSPDYFANVGDAIRTLREDYPSLFYKDLNCGCCLELGHWDRSRWWGQLLFHLSLLHIAASRPCLLQCLHQHSALGRDDVPR